MSLLSQAIRPSLSSDLLFTGSPPQSASVARPMRVPTRPNPVRSMQPRRFWTEAKCGRLTSPPQVGLLSWN